jgi:DNA-binding MarR family transcriptional regulator
VLAKAADPRDGRKVLLRVTAKGLGLVDRLAPHQRRINDVLFECLDARRFAELRALAADLVACGDRAVALL